MKGKMRMWKAGTFNKSEQSLVNSRQSTVHYSLFTNRGFTLMELLVVLFILSITLTFVIPRFMGKEEAKLKSTSRRLLYAVRRLSDEALFKKEKRILNINIGNGEYWEEEKGRKSRLSNNISITDVTFGKKKIDRGVVSIAFFPSGFRDEAEIHLKGKGKGYTVVVPALGERFEIKE